MHKIKAVCDKCTYHGDKKYPEIFICISEYSNRVLMFDTLLCFFSSAPFKMKSVL